MAAKNYKKEQEIINWSEFGKALPQAVELEKSVLGALMIESDAYSVVSNVLEPKSFYKEEHQIIYGAIQTLGKDDKPIDLFTVQDQLKREVKRRKVRQNGIENEVEESNLDKVGGEYYVASLTSDVVSAVHLEYHAKIIAQKHLARELYKISVETKDEVLRAETDVEEQMQTAEEKIFELAQTRHQKEVEKIIDILPEAQKRIQEASKSKSNLTGIASGFYALDEMTKGWQRSDLIIIAARPAMGKTAFVLSMAKNVAAHGTPVAFFSLEMSKVQLVNRLIVNASELHNDKIKSGKLTASEFTELQKGVRQLEEMPIWIDDTASLSISELRTKARKLKREWDTDIRFKDKNGIIIIDYLQLMNASGMAFGNRTEEVSKISRGLKGLAKDLDIPIIALSQLNRGLETRGGEKDENKNEAKKPKLADLRESGSIEQDADIVCFIHRPEKYRIYEDAQGNDLRGVGEILIEKHRNGATGEIRLYFAGEFIMFVNTKDELERLNSKAANAPAAILGSRGNRKPKPTANAVAQVEPPFYESNAPEPSNSVDF
ncbi:MAG: replicative DNA helicase [Prevotellaceae bacterium]|jgi:replicative DNA helicase|nr:replicative DNA helicase [Prevotellaceae bacterium]